MHRRSRRARTTPGPSLGGAGASRGPLHLLRTVLVAAGFLSGAILPHLTGRQDVLAIVVQCGYGALAGWAIGSVIAHLAEKR